MQELPVGAPGLESFPWQLRAVEFCFGGWVSRSPAVIIGRLQLANGAWRVPIERRMGRGARIEAVDRPTSAGAAPAHG